VDPDHTGGGGRLRDLLPHRPGFVWWGFLTGGVTGLYVQKGYPGTYLLPRSFETGLSRAIRAATRE
jgi:hypothetical protein